MDIVVKHVFFYVGLKPGNLMLAEMNDGSIAILRNDVVIPDFIFKAGEMPAALKEYQRLASVLAGHRGNAQNDPLPPGEHLH